MADLKTEWRWILGAVAALGALVVGPVVYPDYGGVLGSLLCWGILAVTISGGFILRVGGGFLLTLMLSGLAGGLTRQLREGGTVVAPQPRPK